MIDHAMVHHVSQWKRNICGNEKHCKMAPQGVIQTKETKRGKKIRDSQQQML